MSGTSYPHGHGRKKVAHPPGYFDMKPLPKPTKRESVLSPRYLEIHATYFRCPWCGRYQNRGGHKEGFVKSGLSNHVEACYEVLLWLSGYIEIDSNLYPSECASPYDRRRIMAMIAARRREGRMPKVGGTS